VTKLLQRYYMWEKISNYTVPHLPAKWSFSSSKNWWPRDYIFPNQEQKRKKNITWWIYQVWVILTVMATTRSASRMIESMKKLPQRKNVTFPEISTKNVNSRNDYIPLPLLWRSGHPQGPLAAAVISN
jgi:hypothetical protein